MDQIQSKVCDTEVGTLPVKAIVFDFDNVIVRNSEECKRKAWFSVFETDSAEMVRLKEAQMIFAHGKGDRFDMLGHVFCVSPTSSYRTNPKIVQIADIYNTVVQRCILEIGITPDDLEAIVSLSERIPLYIISATPEEALKTTLTHLSKQHNLDLMKVFSLVLGTPMNKIENLKLVHAHCHIPFENMLFVGDGKNDYSASEQMSTQFVGVRTIENAQAWSGTLFSKVDTIAEIPDLLNQIIV